MSCDIGGNLEEGCAGLFGDCALLFRGGDGGRGAEGVEGGFGGGFGEGEVEDGDAGAALAGVRAAVAGAEEEGFAGGFVSAEVEHDVGDGHLACFGGVGGGPKEEVAGFEGVEGGRGEGMGVVDAVEGAFFDEPLGDLVGLAGDVGVAEALEEMVDGAGAVHAAAFGVVGVGEVGEVEAGEGEGGGEAGLDEWGEGGEVGEVGGVEGGDGGGRGRGFLGCILGAEGTSRGEEGDQCEVAKEAAVGERWGVCFSHAADHR